LRMGNPCLDHLHNDWNSLSLGCRAWTRGQNFEKCRDLS
jgi:hypothetical protein